MSEKDVEEKEGLVEGVDYVLDEEGKKRHPETGKLLTGFALNKGGINRTGRVRGSRNKSSLAKAQLAIDESSEVAVQVLLEIAQDEGQKGATRVSAAKELLNRAIANEKNKLDEAPVQKGSEGGREGSKHEEEDDTPIVMMQPA